MSGDPDGGRVKLLAGLAAVVIVAVAILTAVRIDEAPRETSATIDEPGLESTTPIEAARDDPVVTVPPSEPVRPVDRLTDAQLVGQRIILAFDGTALPPTVADRIRAGRAAGVLLFERNYASRGQLRSLTRAVQKAATEGEIDAPALVLIDQEGGDVRRLPGPPLISARRMSLLSPDSVREIGTQTGASLGRVGVNVDLAPVADLGYPHGALAAEKRTFGGDPLTVSGLSGAFADGLRRAGVAATAKHFPGFGAADVNTDFAPARIELPASEFRRGLKPFRALIEDRIELVMLSTAVYPSLDARPAALAPAISDDLLRGELGFEGVSVTDDLGAPALAAQGSTEQVAVAAAKAGSDLILFARTLDEGLAAERALVRAARNDQLGDAGMRAAAARILELRASLRSNGQSTRPGRG